MLSHRTVLCSIALWASLGCAPTSVSSTAAPGSPLQITTAARQYATPRRTSPGGGREFTGRWGWHYPWRGPGKAPSWYGTQPHAENSLVRVGAYYYPYYDVPPNVYPVYSMPYTRGLDGFQAAYGKLPAFGALSVPKAKAELVRRR